MQYLERHFLEADPAAYLDYALSPFTPPIGLGKPGAPDLVLMTYERYERLQRAAWHRRRREDDEAEALLLETLMNAPTPTEEELDRAVSECEEPDYPPVPRGLVQLSWQHDDEDVYVPVGPL